MKKTLLVSILCVIASVLMAQSETFDIITYAPPKGWKKEAKETVVSYTITDKKTGTWCRIGIVKSTISKGSIGEDFDSEWQELAAKPYSIADAPQMNEVQEADGWKVKAGAGKFIFNNNNAMAMLTTMSGYSRCVSVVSLTNSQDYIKDIETLLASLSLKKPDVAETPPPANSGSDNNSILGVWTATASDQSSFRVQNGVMNYIVRQYTFEASGKYTFISKTFDPIMDKILLGKESGIYQLSGTTVTISPKKSVLEAWSKQNNADRWGKLISSQNIALEKVTYQFSKHYFSGIKETSLLLQSTNKTNRDGPFTGNAVLNNSWIYGPVNTGHTLIELPDGKLTMNDSKDEDKQTVAASNAFGGYAFTTTDFDDGWKSVVHEDWVEVTEGNIKVLLHYPKDGTIFLADPEPLVNAAWNILVAPRYSNLKNYRTAYINTFIKPYLGMGYATEKASGQNVFVVLFRQGQSGWIEFITPDKNSFTQQFLVDPETIRWDSESDLMNPLAKMANYNKFAVAATDFKGKWTSDFTGIQQLYNIYTGDYAGMHIYQSNEEFIFGNNGTYSWKLLVVNGMAGNAKANQVKSTGTLTVPNSWQVHFTMIENKARTYNAFWSCIKGARILNLLDAQFPGSGIYTKYGLAK
jgi:hypothetical protein